ncbi:YdeI/OmpD-associated family protein [Pedobacter immunditicola]|uniref:YdeI/OmpD-associated family protein n=1 Tax=Pedobacter immunditicola TaxID=3133440 RepID=UPI0030B1AA81
MDNPLFKKLNLKAGNTLLVDQAPENALTFLGEVPASIQLVFNEEKGFDAILLFAKMADELVSRLTALNKYLKPATLIWIAYPKKNSGIATNLSMMGPWEAVKALNLSPCASVAINDVWTGIRLKPIDQIKSSGLAKESIKNNALNEFIDVEKKQVTLPLYLENALIEHPQEYRFFESLSWSNKKEYVLWILTAKQHSTRATRISKMISKLAERKKNPTAK